MGLVSISRVIGLSVSHKIIIALLTVILGLGVWSWYQGQKVDSLKAENHAQAQTILQLEQNQQRLTQQLVMEREAVEQQQRLVSQFRAKAEQSREKVKVILQKELCGVTAMPSNVIDSIKRLHHKGKD